METVRVRSGLRMSKYHTLNCWCGEVMAYSQDTIDAHERISHKGFKLHDSSENFRIRERRLIRDMDRCDRRNHGFCECKGD